MIIASLFASKDQNLKPTPQQPSVPIPFNKYMSFPSQRKNIAHRNAMSKEKVVNVCMLVSAMYKTIENI